MDRKTRKKSKANNMEKQMKYSNLVTFHWCESPKSANTRYMLYPLKTGVFITLWTKEMSSGILFCL